jgi:hypothetical protein
MRGAIRRVGAALAVLLGATGVGAAVALAPARPAFADGPAPCTVGGPPFPFAGFCATYSGDNTWYGSYGPGFPTDESWGFCADPPASGGDYPAPVYAYEPSSAPDGANTGQAGALGFAFSEAQALGWWGGLPGQFTSDQAAVAGKLLYDAVVWGSAVPAMDPGVLAAYQALDGWYVQAVGSTGDPDFTARLVGGGTSFAGQATYQVKAEFPGTSNAVSGLPVELSITGATFDSSSGPTTLTASTNASGKIDVPIFAAGPGVVSVTTTAPGGLGQDGLDFFAPTAFEPTAQSLAAFSAPSNFNLQEPLTSLPTTGTVSILKEGDDPAYYPLGGATFDVMNGATVATTLTTAADGTTSQSAPLEAGVYTVHEASAPPGYSTAPDQSVTATAGQNTVVSFTGPEEDHVIASTLSIEKSDADTGAPLAGAIFDLAYDSANDGTFDRDLGFCTTVVTGSCVPPGNDGAAELLPGRYRVTESAAPPGYAVSAPSSQVIDLAPGPAGTVSFGDPRLVGAVFQKTATGNVNPAELQLGGAVISITQGAAGGPVVASCSTNVAGICTTPQELVSGDRYCWSETTAPPGLAGGASGCFTADDQQADQPITVSDAGEFVAIAVRKADAANLAVGLAGAVFDLYRMPGTDFNFSAPLPDVDSPAGGTLVATTPTGADGIGTFPLQLPGYEYCAVEEQPPANYTAESSEQCTGVLAGSTVVPPAVTTLPFADEEQTVDLSVYKYNSLTPNTGIPGATYDLYVQGPPPPSGITGTPPTDAATEAGDTWYARGTTGTDGRLSFTVPAGYSWCVLEASAPVDYVLDPALRCSAVLTADSVPQATTIAVPEALATVHITAYKYNSRQPDTVIPGATYEVVANGAVPPGAPSSVPAGTVVPGGDRFWAEGTTNAKGVLTFAVPAGYSWCLHELIAPTQYEADPAFHCTAVLTNDTAAAAATIAVPEVPMTSSLAFTGFQALLVGGVGAGACALGLAMVAVTYRRRKAYARGVGGARR